LDNSKQFSTSLEGDVVFFRDRNYFFYRPEDISEKSLNKFVKQMPAGLDGWSSFCATLSEAQMRVICADEFVWPQGMQIPGDMMAPNFFTLRFWGFLHPIQRERAISEQGLPVDHLSRSQQTAMQAALGQMLIPDPFATIERIHVTNTPSHGYCFMMDGVPMNFVEDLAEAKQMFKEQDPKSTDFIVERTQDYYEFDFVLPDGQIYQDSFPFSQFKRVDAKDTGKTPNAGG
jgi:hypothetical protein